MLYHYTREAGLKGILESGTFRLTAIARLNDPTEWSHGFSIAAERMNIRAAAGPGEAQLFAQSFERMLIDDGISEIAGMYVGCFSGAGDDLGQWRAYAADGHGFALGFETKALEDAFVAASELPSFSNQTFRVKYDDAVARQLSDQIIDRMFELISLPRGRSLDSQTLSEYMGELLITTWMHCLRGALFFKHEGYRGEQEYRFMRLHSVGPGTAPARVPFHQFDWRATAADALRTVVIGPAADKASATKFAEECLQIPYPAGLADGITGSKIPYRS